MTPKTLAAAAAATLTLGAAVPAGAHVTVQPKQATPGEYTVLDVRVPNESDTASTVRIDVQMPPGFASASYQPVPGWTVKVKKERLATPIPSDDGPITEGVTQITWTGDGRSGRIAPGAFQDFPISVRVPGKAGETLTFKAVQRYSDGEIARWIGAPEADTPAPTVKLVAATAEAAAPPAEAEAEAADGAKPETAKAEKEEKDGGDGLAIAALAVGGLGLILGAAGLGAGRAARRQTA